MINNKIKIGVIGLGYLGKFHYQKYKLNRSVNLTAVVDSQINNLDFIDNNKILKTDKYTNIVDNIDAVSIVTPTNTHYEIAKFFLENKKHVLLEKPMTETVSQARKLNDLAKRNK